MALCVTIIPIEDDANARPTRRSDDDWIANGESWWDVARSFISTSFLVLHLFRSLTAINNIIPIRNNACKSVPPVDDHMICFHQRSKVLYTRSAGHSRASGMFQADLSLSLFVQMENRSTRKSPFAPLTKNCDDVQLFDNFRQVLSVSIDGQKSWRIATSGNSF